MSLRISFGKVVGACVCWHYGCCGQGTGHT